jgi:outer membrane protein OmpA-like peptidoglycan-associated protein
MSTDLRLITDPASGKREGAEVEIVTSEEITPDPELRYGGRDLISCQFRGERLTSVLKNGEQVPFKQCETFMVFFDWNKSDIRPEAHAVVESAAMRAKQSPYQNLVVIGHADRSGTGKYNFALSDRRANAVKSILVRLGIPASKISTEPKGETDLLVPTEDGVREPQNRRAEIKISR